MIRVCFGTNNKWTSKLIRWVTKSEWSHVWIEYSSHTWNSWWTIHSSSDGVVNVPSAKVEKDYKVGPKYAMTHYNHDKLSNGFNWAMSRMGAKYDYGVIWNGLLYLILMLTGWSYLWKLVHRNTSRFSCSEFVSGFLKAAEVNGTESFDPELTMEKDLRGFCSKSSLFEEE